MSNFSFSVFMELFFEFECGTTFLHSVHLDYLDNTTYIKCICFSVQECGDLSLTGPTGVIFSPYYPNNYTNGYIDFILRLYGKNSSFLSFSLTCVWQITGAVEKVIQLNLLDIKVKYLLSLTKMYWVGGF